jgi:hypothetical protein
MIMSQVTGHRSQDDSKTRDTLHTVM